MPRERLTPGRFQARIDELAQLADQRGARFPDDTPDRRRQRMARAVLDLRFFFQTYLPHYARDEGSPFHQLLNLMLETAAYGVVRAPRGHAKTTIVSFAYTVHQVACARVLRGLEDGTLERDDPALYADIRAVEQKMVEERIRAGELTCAGLGIPEHWDPEVTARMDAWLREIYDRTCRERTIPTRWDPYIQVVGVDQATALEVTSAIRAELERNELLRGDWGKLTPVYVGDWFRKMFKRAASDADFESNGVRVRAFGASEALRGGKHGEWRPTLALLDDPDSEESVRTDLQRARMLAKVQRALIGGLDERKRRVFIVGTPLHAECLVCTLTEKPAFQRRWTGLRFRAMDEQGTVLYPAKWSAERLGDERFENEDGYGPELDDKPPQEAGHPFHDLDYYDRETYAHLDLPVILAFDPSLGRSKTSDFQALVELRGPTPDGDLLVHRVELWRIPSPPALVSEIRRVHAEDRPTASVIETIGFQSMLLYVPAESGQGIDSIPWVCLDRQEEAKDVRIRSMAPAINRPLPGQPRRPRILFPSDGSCRPLERQVLAYPVGKRDGVDALEMAKRHADGAGDWGWT